MRPWPLQTKNPSTGNSLYPSCAGNIFSCFSSSISRMTHPWSTRLLLHDQTHYVDLLWTTSIDLAWYDAIVRRLIQGRSVYEHRATAQFLAASCFRTSARYPRRVGSTKCRKVPGCPPLCVASCLEGHFVHWMHAGHGT